MSEREAAASTVAAFPAAGDADDPLAAPQERLAAVGPAAPAPEPVRRSDLAAKLAVQLTPEQRQWVDEEARRRGIPKSAILRDVVASAIAGPAVDGQADAGGVVVDPVAVGGAGAGGAAAARSEVPPKAAPASSVAGSPGGVSAATPVAESTGPGTPAASARGSGDGAPSTGAPAASTGAAPQGAEDAGVGADPPPPEYARLPSGVSLPVCDLPGPAPAVRESIPAEVVDDPAAARALVLQTGGRDPEGSLGFYIMVPGVGLVRTPPPPALDAAAASRVGPPGVGAAQLGGGSVLPYWMRVGIAVLCAAGVIFAFAFLGSSVVANRYYFQEVQTAPGRSVFYKVDRWTGEMTRCRTDLAAVGPVC